MRLTLLISLALLTTGAWAITIIQSLSMSMPMGIAVRGSDVGDGMAGMAMAGMSGAGWSIAGALVFVAVWTIMMAAMMLPAAAPMILIFASAQARRAENAAIPTWIFVGGYLLVWAAVGILVYVIVQLASDFATRLTSLQRATWAPYSLGMTLIAAGLYQFTPLKRACLGHCRSPFAFVAQHWRDGRGGALAMGMRHGIYCLGCCWALFALLVAAGIMSLAWMLLLTLFVFAEKVFPWGRQVPTAIGILLIILGLVVSGGIAILPGTA
jgi:predicted metal-binding membrane protein